MRPGCMPHAIVEKEIVRECHGRRPAGTGTGRIKGFHRQVKSSPICNPCPASVCLISLKARSSQ